MSINADQTTMFQFHQIFMNQNEFLNDEKSTHLTHTQ